MKRSDMLWGALLITLALAVAAGVALARYEHYLSMAPFVSGDDGKCSFCRENRSASWNLQKNRRLCPECFRRVPIPRDWGIGHIRDADYGNRAGALTRRAAS